MAQIPLDETIEIPIDSLTNEQRDIVNFIAMGNGFKNPVQTELDKVFQLVEGEKEALARLISQSPDGCVEGIATSACPVPCQCLVELDFLFDTLKYELDLVQLHTNKISGVEADTSDFFTRLSVAGQFTKIMNTMTGKDTERYSHVFNSITGGSQFCINKMLQDCLCKQGTGCGPFTSQSGLSGVVNLLCQQPELCPCVLGTLLPQFIQCVRDLIRVDEENLCEAQRVIKNYTNAQTVASASASDPLMASVVEGVFATSGLREKLKALKESNAVSDEFSQSVSKFFPEFGDAEGGGTAGCEDNVPTVVPGIAGPPGVQGCRGSTGPAGPQGPCGDDCDANPDVGACCVGDYCLAVTEANCAFYSGDYYGDNSFCFDGVSGVRCLPPGGCTDTGDCNPGLICCNSQCTNPCPANLGGGCPPCPVCPEGFTECPSGSGNCCQTGDGSRICCEGECSLPCPTIGGCPNCFGNCCSGDCCGGNCCTGEDICCGGTCCPGGRCCGGACCDIGSFCCDGVCVGNGTECCGSGEYACQGSCCPSNNSCCTDGCCPDPDAICCGGGDGIGDCCSACCRGGNCCAVGSQCDCPPGEQLDENCECVCPGGGQPCGNIGCCPSSNDQCCSPVNTPSNFCCGQSETCCGGEGPPQYKDQNTTCCDSGETCCSTDAGVAKRCCTNGETCCDGLCCAVGETCCNGACCPAGNCCSGDGADAEDYCRDEEICTDGSSCPCGESCCPGGGCYKSETQFCCGGSVHELTECLYSVSGECQFGASSCCCCNYENGTGTFCENGCCPGSTPGSDQRCSSSLCSTGTKEFTNPDGTKYSVSWTGADTNCPDCFGGGGDQPLNLAGGCGCDCPCGQGGGDYPCDCKVNCVWGGSYCPQEYSKNCIAPDAETCPNGDPRIFVLSCEGGYVGLPCETDTSDCCLKLECKELVCNVCDCGDLDPCLRQCWNEEDIEAGCEQVDCKRAGECSCAEGDFVGKDGTCDCEAYCGCRVGETINVNEIPCDDYNPGNPQAGTGCAVGTARPDCIGTVGSGGCANSNGIFVEYSSGFQCDPIGCCECGDGRGGGDPDDEGGCPCADCGPEPCDDRPGGGGNPQCFPPCVLPAVCSNGRCVQIGVGKGCINASDCPPGDICLNGFCVPDFGDGGGTGPEPPECDDNTPCPVGQECNAGVCEEIVGSSCPCPPGYTCYQEGTDNERCVLTTSLGRCCPPISNCTCGDVCCLGYVLQADCSVGDTWNQGLSCANACPCTEPAAQGVCCFGGTCVGIVEEASCALQGSTWYRIPQDASETDCNNTFCCIPAGVGALCTSSPCGCANDLVCCTDGPEAGTCQPEGTCDLPLGECCQEFQPLQGGGVTCTVVDAPTCADIGGTWTLGGDCANGIGNCPIPPVLGSCCVFRPSTGDYVCNSNVLDINCNHPNIWSENISCGANQCDCSTGGCCVNGECRSDLNTRVACESEPGGVFFTCRDCDGPFAPVCDLCNDDNDCSPYPGTCCDNPTGICTSDACGSEAAVGICCRDQQQGCNDDVWITRNCCKWGSLDDRTQQETNFCPYEDAHSNWAFNKWQQITDFADPETCFEAQCRIPLSCCGAGGCYNLTPECPECGGSGDLFCYEQDPEIEAICECQGNDFTRYNTTCTGSDCPCYPGSPGCDPDPSIRCNCDGSCSP